MKPAQDSTLTTKTYLALGDSMSIDFYTGQAGGGAVNQLYKRLCGHNGIAWRLDDRTADGQVMAGVDYRGPDSGEAVDLITMTIGGNDLLQNMDADPARFLPEFARDYARLTREIREAHPHAIVVVGNIYRPASDLFLGTGLEAALNEANRIIGLWVHQRGFRLADIHRAFAGHEDEYLCYSIEPSLKGATVIADLFERLACQLEFQLAE